MMPSSLSERDRRVIWHPYTQHLHAAPPVPIVSGEDALLRDEKGNTYIDAISSWWVNIHGHAHPYIAEKIFEQAKKLEHVIFTGFTHEPAVSLAERLLRKLPGDFARIFYSDNGSTAVEVAIKMAIQYGGNREPAHGISTSHPRKQVLAFHHAYHGDTFGSMSISERGVFTDAFRDYLFDVIFLDTPTPGNIQQLKEIVRIHSPQAACFIYEPLLQAAGGMRMYDAALMDELLSTVRSENILCIADEVLTGFGRTGKLFACDYLVNKPDIICLSKALTGGTMALGVTACSQKIFEAFLSEDRTKTFFHGHSFTANPLACTAALASLDLLEQEECLQQMIHIAERNEDFVQAQKHSTAFHHLRRIGTVMAFELHEGNQSYLDRIGTTITEQALRNGIYLRPLGNTVYIMPPYCITDDQLNSIYTFLKQLGNA